MRAMLEHKVLRTSDAPMQEVLAQLVYLNGGMMHAMDTRDVGSCHAIQP
jgi:hypothetical protein